MISGGVISYISSYITSLYTLILLIEKDSIESDNCISNFLTV